MSEYLDTRNIQEETGSKERKTKMTRQRSEVKGTTHPRPDRREGRPGEDAPPTTDPSGGAVTDELSTQKRKTMRKRKVRERGDRKMWEVMGCRQGSEEEQPMKLCRKQEVDGEKAEYKMKRKLRNNQ